MNASLGAARPKAYFLWTRHPSLGGFPDQSRRVGYTGRTMPPWLENARHRIGSRRDLHLRAECGPAEARPRVATWRIAVLVLAVSAIGCAGAGTPRPSSTPKAIDAAGVQVVARIAALDPKSYTDHEHDGSVLVVSDVFVFAVLEPHELAGITVDAYYRGSPLLGDHVLSVGDVVGFQLPSQAQRSGVFLWDLRDLRLLRPSSQQPKPDRESRFAVLEDGQSVTDRGVTLTLHHKSGGTPDSEGWYLARSTGCDFSVLLPAPYNDFTSSVMTPEGEVLARHVLDTTTADGAQLTVVCMDSATLADPLTYPEQYALNLAAGGRMLAKVPITQGGLSGLEVSIIKGDGDHVDARVLVSEERAYELLVEYPARAWQAASLARDAVFRSFTAFPERRRPDGQQSDQK